MRATHLILIQFLLIQFCLYGRANFQNIHRKSKTLNAHRSPVILIPGLGGSRLEAKLDKSYRSHWWCYKTTDDYFDMWLSFRRFLPFSIDCFVDNMKLNYDKVARISMNTAGVDIKVPFEFGKTTSIEWLSRYFPAYFYKITQALVNKGYIRDQSVLGAPYDFRKGPVENENWFNKLKNLTENAYETNNNTPVIYIAHSMGGRMLLHFLHKMPEQWKDKYVKRIINIAVPWGGCVKAMRAASVGIGFNDVAAYSNPMQYKSNKYGLGFSLLSNEKTKQIVETFPSIAWLMPSKYFWKSNDVLATIGGKNYTIENLDQYFHDIGISDMVDIRADLADYYKFDAPGVEVHCLYSTKSDTVERLDFGAKFNLDPTSIEGDGDGTVNAQSLIGCKYWKNTTNHKIYIQEFPGEDHVGILNHYGVIDYILNAVAN